MKTNLENPQNAHLSLYLHIPFCEVKCFYCDFNTYANIESLIPGYVNALTKEICFWNENLRDYEVKTIFFGGGTPSYLKEADLSHLMDSICNNFNVIPDIEVTIEANPGDIDISKLSTYLKCGINRLSMGAQSFDDHMLKLLGRKHTAIDILNSYQLATDAGFKNISLDLIYGLPYQTVEGWRDTLDNAISLNPVHLSMYCLTIEEGTPMDQWVRIGKISKPDEDLAADMYLLAQQKMADCGYHHYEISNWSVRGFESQHNLTYWRNQSYLGLGPGAHSYLNNQRFSNIKPPREYINKLSDYSILSSSTLEERINSSPVINEIEIIDRRAEIAETLMMGLRLHEGVNLQKFKQRFNSMPSDVYPKEVDELYTLGLLEKDDETLRLTPRGKMLGNEVFSKFF